LFDVVLRSHRKTPPLTEVEPPAASGHWRFLRRPEISTRLNVRVLPKQTASGLRKKPRPDEPLSLTISSPMPAIFVETSVPFAL
jgi:hypothetical protein